PLRVSGTVDPPKARARPNDRAPPTSRPPRRCPAERNWRALGCGRGDPDRVAPRRYLGFKEGRTSDGRTAQANTPPNAVPAREEAEPRSNLGSDLPLPLPPDQPRARAADSGGPSRHAGSRAKTRAGQPRG